MNTDHAPKPTAIRWLDHALALIEADYQRSADTHLIALRLPAWEHHHIDFYLKDESTHPTGSLKHRLARSLFLYALCNGWLHQGSTVVEASSGSTAISEAYFARLLGLRFVAVMPRDTSAEKVALIRLQGGDCHFVDSASMVYSVAQSLARDCGGHYMDQFTYAERATDWRGNNNIAQSIFSQMEQERYAEPHWIVVGAGTGGTSATVGRFVRFRKLASKICVPDPEGSAFAEYFTTADASTMAPGSRIEGIGRPQVEPSFIRTVIDHVLPVLDQDSIAAMHVLGELLGRRVGPSTGTNFVAMLRLGAAMASAGQRGSILSLLCDAGERYLASYHDTQWVTKKFGDCTGATARIRHWVAHPQDVPGVDCRASVHPYVS